jgi:hypothetical protein
MKKVNTLIILQLLIYLFMAVTGPSEQISDAATHEGILRKLFVDGSIYPSGNMIFANYINNPGAVNLYLLIWKVLGFPSMRVLFVCNALAIWIANVGLVLLFKKLGANEKKQTLLLLVSTFYLTNLGLVCTLLSDVIAYTFMVGFIWIVYHITNEKNKRWTMNLFFYSSIGIFLATFNYIRPVGTIALLVLLVSIILICIKNKLNIKLALSYVFVVIVSFFLTKSSISQFHNYKTGYSINGSISLGYNLLMGSGEDADGSWTGGVFNKGGKGYFDEIKHTDVLIKDKRWIGQSIDTIMNNPVNFLVLGVRKVLLTMSYDVLGLEKLTKSNGSSMSAASIIRNGFSNLLDVMIFIVNNVVYWLLLLNFVFLLIKKFVCAIFRKNFNFLYTLYFYLSIFFVLYVLLIFTVIGGARYHHVLMPIFFLYLGMEENLFKKHYCL